MYKVNEKKKHSHIRIIVYIAVAASILLLILGSVLAKYVWNKSNDHLMSAKEFYFTSDLLTTDTKKYVLNSNTDKISFTLGNNADELRFSDDDITYTVTIKFKDSDDPCTATATPKEGTLNKGAISTVKIDVSDLVVGKTYIVTATGSAGYEQTLSAEFTVSDNNANLYKHLQVTDEYVLLTVWTENLSGDLTIQVNTTDLIPDNTDPILSDVFNYKDGIYTELVGDAAIKDLVNFQTTYSSYTYRFFIYSGSRFSVDQFEVSLNSGAKTAIGSTP